MPILNSIHQYTLEILLVLLVHPSIVLIFLPLQHCLDSLLHDMSTNSGVNHVSCANSLSLQSQLLDLIPTSA